MNTPGSSLYYSVLYCDAATREKILSIRAIYEKLSTIKPVAYDWWREELQKKYPDLLPVLDAFLQDTQTSLYEDEASLNYFYQQTAGLTEKVIGRHCGITQNVEKLADLGIFIAKIKHLNQLRHYIDQGKIYISGEKLIRHHTNLYEFSQLTLTPTLKKLLEDEVLHIKKHYHRQSFLPTQILGNIYNALLDEIVRANFPIFTHQLGLTPLRKWWIAWRTK